MAEYSYNEIMKMQNDAIRRVNEMQKRAKAVVGEELKEEKAPLQEVTMQQNKNNSVKRVKMPNDYLEELKGFASTSSYFENDNSDNEEKKQPTQKETNEKNNIQHSIKNQSQNDFFKNILGELNLDSDKALILSLILLLTEENADEMLVLALLYMLT